jgi:hypothetical protein
MGFMQPKPPAARMPPPAAHPPSLGSAATALEQEASKKRAAEAEGMGMDDTIKTSPQGLTAPQTARTTLLGG